MSKLTDKDYERLQNQIWKTDKRIHEEEVKRYDEDLFLRNEYRDKIWEIWHFISDLKEYLGVEWIKWQEENKCGIESRKIIKKDKLEGGK